MIPYNYISNDLCDNDGRISRQFHIFVDSLREKLNNVTSVTSNISAVGDLTIQVDNLYFNNNLWPLHLPTTTSVLYRDETEALSWVDPSDLNLEPETGKIEVYYGTTAPTGWVVLNNGTIGSATSGATTRANADCENLFLYLWNNFDDSIAPVTGGRGASAAADWSANKKIKLDNLTTRLMSNVSSTDTHMSVAGADSYYLTTDMLPVHSHTAWVNSNFADTTDSNKAAYVGQHYSGLSLTKHPGSTYVTESASVNFINSKYDTLTFTAFSVAQPSVNVNLIIKL